MTHPLETLRNERKAERLEANRRAAVPDWIRRFDEIRADLYARGVLQP